MKLSELYQYIKTGKFRTDMILKYKHIRTIEILRLEDGSGENSLIRLFFDEKAEIDKTDIFRVVCHAVEREILQSVENGKLWRFSNDFYLVDVFYWDDNRNLKSTQISEFAPIKTEVKQKIEMCPINNPIDQRNWEGIKINMDNWAKGAK